MAETTPVLIKSPYYLFVFHLLIRMCIISEHFWSLLHQYDDRWQEGKLMELVTNQKLANTTEHMDSAEVVIPFHFCLWEIILLLDFMTKSNPQEKRAP